MKLQAAEEEEVDPVGLDSDDDGGGDGGHERPRGFWTNSDFGRSNGPKCLFCYAVFD